MVANFDTEKEKRHDSSLQHGVEKIAHAVFIFPTLLCYWVHHKSIFEEGKKKKKQIERQVNWFIYLICARGKC